MAWILVLYLMNTILMIIVAIREARRPATALSYLSISLVLPLIGFLIYLIMTQPIPKRRERLTADNNRSDKLPESFGQSASVIARCLHHLSVDGLRASQVEVLTNGVRKFEELARAIKDAKTSIDVEYYIFRNDSIGKQIISLLIDRANAGVRIRFLRDGWGSRKLPKSVIEQMTNAGIECRTFFPVRFPWFHSPVNNRDHCKIVVVDQSEALTGGINVGDEYAGMKPGVGFWRDTHMKIKGEVISDLNVIFDSHWNLASIEPSDAKANKHRQGLSRNNGVRSWSMAFNASSHLLTEFGPEVGILETDTSPETSTNTRRGHDVYVQTLEGNPGLPTQVIRQTYFLCITEALSSVDITTPYFLPDADIIMALKTAVERGVRVRLLLPRRVDHKLVGLAARTYYGELLEAGVHIYLYDKGILHAKTMFIDNEVSVVGAANFDMRSFRLDYEVCQVIYSKDVAKELSSQFERDLADSIPETLDHVERRSAWQRVGEQGARVLTPLL